MYGIYALSIGIITLCKLYLSPQTKKVVEPYPKLFGLYLLPDGTLYYPNLINKKK